MSLGTVTFVDVAQGDCIVAVDEATGRAVVIDCPTGMAALAEAVVRARGATVDTFLLTHLHADHMGDALELIDRVAPRRLRTNVTANPRRSAKVEAMLRALVELEDAGITVEPATTERPRPLGAQVSYQVLAPSHAQAADACVRDKPNDGSVVCRLKVGDRVFLLPADATERVWTRLLSRPNRLRAHVLMLPHHGGRLDSRDDVELLGRILDAVEPDSCVVSVGTTNDHGHPRPEHLQLAARGRRLLCTQVNHRCLGTAPLPSAAVAALPDAALSAGGMARPGCSCAGTTTFVVTPTGMTVTPDGSAHGAVIDELEAPQCRT